jgi:trans-aconitate 2-methyltransferase
MADWNVDQYLKFADHRARPALELLSRIPLETPQSVFDLGCGAGNVTRFLAGRWPDARVTGIDGSAAMLDKARQQGIDAHWLKADLTSWVPERPADVLYSNAALQWLDHHETLFPRLFGLLAPGGCLAIQMPRQTVERSHILMDEVASSGPWRDRLRAIKRTGDLPAPQTYYHLLAPLTRALDIWETVYLQTLEGRDAVVEWTRGTALRPFIDALEGEERDRFLAEYTARIREAYPRREDGRTVFPFRRMFIVARKDED